MAKKCGCTAASCSCKMEDSTSFTFTGYGSPDVPYEANLIPPITIGSSSLPLSLTETEDGDLALSATILPPTSYTKFTSNGTFVLPSNISILRVMLIGGGGGGGGGGWHNGTGTIMYGGQGGSGGNVTNFYLYANTLPTNVPIVIGNGGDGGDPAVTGGSSFGFTGSAGGDTLFGTTFKAYGGAPGGGGSFVVPAPSAVVNRGGTVLGQDGYDAMTTRGHPALAPAAGGMGMGNQGSEATAIAPLGGGFSIPGRGARESGYASDAPTTPGQIINGLDEKVTMMGSGGPGGFFGDGSPGGLYGAGGGGGASGFGTTNASSGGDGAKGIAIVMGW